MVGVEVCRKRRFGRERKLLLTKKKMSNQTVDVFLCTIYRYFAKYHGIEHENQYAWFNFSDESGRKIRGGGKCLVFLILF